MTCNVFGGTLSLTQSINHILKNKALILQHADIFCRNYSIVYVRS